MDEPTTGLHVNQIPNNLDKARFLGIMLDLGRPVCSGPSLCRYRKCPVLIAAAIEKGLVIVVFLLTLSNELLNARLDGIAY